MSKSVTLLDIAKICNTSNVTVSKALANKKGVSEELRMKIKKTAEEMGYVGPKTSLGRDNKLVGVLIPDRFMNPNGSFYWALYNDLVREFGKNGYFCLIETLSGAYEESLVMPKLLSEEKVTSLVSLGQLKEEYVEKLRENISPLLLLDYYTTDTDIDCVITNGYGGAYDLATYLIRYGHKKIGFIGTVRSTTSIFDRYMGYMKALIEHGLDVRKDWVIDDRDENGSIELVFPEEMPTAFVCNCDETALKAIRKLDEMGLRVPEDISIVGYDNYLISYISKPSITTVNVDSVQMASEAVRCLTDKIANSSKAPEKITISGRIIEKESVRDLNA